MEELSKLRFDRDDTKSIKGVAIILMLFHHLAAFPNRLPLDFEGFVSLWKPFVTEGYLEDLAFCAKICVSIFFFLGGYGLYKKYSADKLNIGESIINLYKAYWKVFLIFIPIGLCFFVTDSEEVNELCRAFFFERKQEGLSVLVGDFLGISSKICQEWWFFFAYICVIPLGYLFVKATRRLNDFWAEIFLVFGIDILIRNIFTGLTKTTSFASLSENFYYLNFCKMTAYASCFFAGIVFSKHNAVCSIKKKLTQLPFSPILCILACGVLYYSRTYIIKETADIIYCGLFIPLISVILDSIKPLKAVFKYIGKYSTNMWLCHAFFCYYFYEATKIVYITQSVWVDLAVLAALSLVSSIIIDKFWCAVAFCCKKISKNKAV